MTSAFDQKRSVGYDDRIKRMIPGYDVLHQLTDISLGAELSADARVLMVGAGTGREILESGGRHSGWAIVATDPAPEMAKIARDKIAAKGLSDRVRWHEGPLGTLRDEAPFDAATLLLVLHFLADAEKVKLLMKIGERLKPGAPLIVAAFAGDPETTRMKRIYDLCRVWAVAQGIDPQEAAEKIDLRRKDLYLVPEDRMKALFRDAGFIDVQRIFQALACHAWIARTPR
jgi:tRNA (cmo5U34)-methyltransferase